MTQKLATKYSHYYRDTSKFKGIDIYRILKLFEITDPCLQHAAKKILVAGGRTAGKDITQDIDEAIATLTRWKEMREEEK